MDGGLSARQEVPQGTWTVVLLHGEHLEWIAEGLEAAQYERAVPTVLHGGALRVDYNIGTPEQTLELWAPWTWVAARPGAVDGDGA